MFGKLFSFLGIFLVAEYCFNVFFFFLRHFFIDLNTIRRSETFLGKIN